MTDRLTHYRAMRTWPRPVFASLALHQARALAGELAPRGFLERRAQVREAIEDIGSYWSSNSTMMTAEGYDVTITVDADDYADTSYIGKFTNRWTPDAVPNPDNPRGHDTRTPRYFEPTQTLEERRAWYRANGYPRHEAYTRARSEVIEDARLATRVESYAIIVTVSRAGVTLAESALGGLDIDPYGPVEDRLDYITESAVDLVTEAIEDAKDAEARLCATRHHEEV